MSEKQIPLIDPRRDSVFKTIFSRNNEESRIALISLLSAFTGKTVVEGVGPKSALKILSSVSESDITSVLEEGEIAKLEKLTGVGKKTDQKMLITLKGKLTLLDDVGAPQKRRVETVSPWEDVIKALVDMGYDRHNTEEVVHKLVNEITNQNKDTDSVSAGSPAENNMSKSAIEETLFRRAIVELAT